MHKAQGFQRKLYWGHKTGTSWDQWYKPEDYLNGHRVEILISDYWNNCMYALVVRKIYLMIKPSYTLRPDMDKLRSIYLTNYICTYKKMFSIWLMPWSDRKGWRIKDFNRYLSQISDHVNLYHMCDIQLRSVKETQHMRRKLIVACLFDYRKFWRFSWQR